jgi:hypothetical protein
MVKNAWKESDKGNREIDATLDKMMEDYKRKAVEHRVLTGGAVQIDTFIMKVGSVVYCRTSMRNNAKAISCN